MTKRFLLLLLIILAMTALALPSTATRAQDGPAPFADIDDFNAALEAARTSGEVEPFWERVLAHQAMPLIFGDTAVFFYRGEAESVEWRGDFSGWDTLPAYVGSPLAASDIWLMQATFPLDARLDYKIVTDGSNWLLDDLNPLQQLGGYGPNNYFAMPDYVIPAETIARDDIEHGTLSEPQFIESAALGYTVAYQVYTPAPYETMSSLLPSIYVTDGHEYANPDMGAMVNVLDNLIADGQIRPVVAIFVDPREPDRPSNNRRQDQYVANRDFGRFLAEELVPTIQADYHTMPNPQSTAILGTSLGGINSAFMGLQYAHVFGLIGIHSPAFWAAPDVVLAYQARFPLPLRVFMSTGTIYDTADEARQLRDILEERGYDLRYVEVNEGHSWGNWRALMDEPLIYFFGLTE